MEVRSAAAAAKCHRIPSVSDTVRFPHGARKGELMVSAEGVGGRSKWPLGGTCRTLPADYWYTACYYSRAVLFTYQPQGTSPRFFFTG